MTDHSPPGNLAIFPTQRPWPSKYLGEGCLGFGDRTERIPCSDLFYTSKVIPQPNTPVNSPASSEWTTSRPSVHPSVRPSIEQTSTLHLPHRWHCVAMQRWARETRSQGSAATGRKLVGKVDLLSANCMPRVVLSTLHT